MAKTNDSLPVIKKTNDYSIFKRVQGNRNPNKAHIKRLIDSFSEDSSCIKYNPILVNEDFMVVDGQHRLEALKKAELPVYYVMAEGIGLIETQMLNKLSKPWSPMDYAKSYAELGNKHYEAYISFKHEYKLNHDVLMRYLSLDNPITAEMFRSGKFKAQNLEQSKDLCNCLESIGIYHKRNKIRSFALGFKTVWENPKYNHERLIMKLEQQPNVLQDRALPEDYIRDIEALYNHSLEAKDKVRFF